MLMIIFADVILFENIIVNTFLLYITMQTIKLKVKFRHLLLSGTIGSLYIFILLYPRLRLFTMIPFKILVALVMVMIAYRSKNFFTILKELLILILFTMLLAGVCLFCEQSSDFTFFIRSFRPCKYLLISLMIIYMFTGRAITFVKDRKEINSLIYDLDIIMGNAEIKIKAFLDTGNGLREPATNLPVILVEKIIFSKVDLAMYDKFYIPYKMADGTSGKLPAFKPERIKIYYNNTYQYKDAVIAICDYKFSDLNQYEGLLSRGII